MLFSRVLIRITSQVHEAKRIEALKSYVKVCVDKELKVGLESTHCDLIFKCSRDVHFVHPFVDVFVYSMSL